MFKRILIISLTIIIAFSGFLIGFFSVGCMSIYAANNDSLYVPLRDQSDLVKAFQAYCKSRDLTIDGSVADAVTKFTTGSFNSACNVLGINISQLQAELKAEYDSSGKPVKFLFTSSGVMAMNRIFAQFLQDNNLEVGDSASPTNNTVYDGELYVDADGNQCLVYLVTNVNGYQTDGSFLVKKGTPYIHDADYYIDNFPPLNDNVYRTANINAHLTATQTSSFYVVSRNGNCSFRSADPNVNGNSGTFYGLAYTYNFGNSTYGGYGNLAICKIGNVYYLCGYSEFNENYSSYATFKYYCKNIAVISNPNTTNVNVFLTTNNTVINNNNYEGDTYITDEGDVIINNPVQPNNPNDVIHNVPKDPISPNDDGGWDIDLPDIDIPSLPIGNLSEKFPFSIPWDLVAFYAMLDAEPEAPRFNGIMDLTLVQWNYDIDLSPFDSAAELCRKLQFGLFVVGLIVASRSIIRG